MRRSVTRSVTKLFSVRFDCLLAPIAAITVSRAAKAVYCPEAHVDATAGAVAFSSHRMTVFTKLVCVHVNTVL